MKAQIRLGRLAGIEIGLHYSWFVIAALIALSLSAHFGSEHADWSTALVWGVSLVTALLFFAALLAHEMSHALVARARGTPVPSITLFALGGVSNLGAETKDPKTELVMAAVGPLTSAAIGAAALGLALASGWTAGSVPGGAAVSMLVWLGYINLALAVFNTLPGFPMDGGRVLRAAIWWFTGDSRRATRVAAGIGSAVALGLVFIGMLQVFAGQGLGGLWLAFIGWFLLSAAGAEEGRAEAMAVLRRVPVRDLMSRECLRISAQTSVQAFVEGELLSSARRCYLVVEDDEPIGLITPTDVGRVERDARPTTRVGEVMRPRAALHAVSSDAPASEPFEIMGREDVNQVAVEADGRLRGVVTRGDLLRLLQTRREVAA